MKNRMTIICVMPIMVSIVMSPVVLMYDYSRFANAIIASMMGAHLVFEALSSFHVVRPQGEEEEKRSNRFFFLYSLNSSTIRLKSFISIAICFIALPIMSAFNITIVTIWMLSVITTIFILHIKSIVQYTKKTYEESILPLEWNPRFQYVPKINVTIGAEGSEKS